MDDRAALGRRGEKQAERYLRRLGYRIVTRNYTCPLGEIDLVALDGKIVVFVEVKTRSDRDHADPEDAVNPSKQKRLIRAARFFIQQTRSEDRMVRFDVVGIVVDEQGRFVIEHTPDAFTTYGSVS